MPSSFGKVYLVGAGPGDPGLLTLRGRQCLEQAQVVIYDALVHPALLEYAPRAELIFAGKQADRHSLPQEEITRILLEQARRYDTVVRLKGGDPFIFGRGGEEALALAEAGIPFEVVPGVTAATGAAAYAGIPLTHRGLATSVTFLTGHVGTGEGDLPEFANIGLEGTLVFYMGVKNLGRIVQALLDLGRAPETPAALIEWGTYARQRTLSATLDTIEAQAREAGIGAPSLFVVGETVSLREQLAWFEARPLFGLRIALTHSAQPKGRLEAQLQELGATLFSFPTLELAPAPPPALPAPLDSFDWIVFTSANAAQMLFEYLDQQGLDARALARSRICAVGSNTSEALRRRFLRPDAEPQGYEPEQLLETLQRTASLRGMKVLLPRSDIARASIADTLRGAGAAVREWAAYEKRSPAASPETVQALLQFDPALVVFTNAGAVQNFAQLLGPALSALKQRAAFASIGPVTSRAAEDQGLEVAVEPAHHDLLHLVEAICAWSAGGR